MTNCTVCGHIYTVKGRNTDCPECLKRKKQSVVDVATATDNTVFVTSNSGFTTDSSNSDYDGGGGDFGGGGASGEW